MIRLKNNKNFVKISRDLDINYDVFLQWEITRNCNLNCDYCTIPKIREGVLGPIDIQKVIKKLNSFNKTFLINFTGGEPFLVPNFTDLVYEITKKHYVTIDTNFSLKEAHSEFLNKINPERVLQIRFSIHVSEMERLGLKLQDSFSLAKKFQKKGFRIRGIYVAYPPIFKRLKEDIESFKKYMIDVDIRPFKGEFENKRYPLDKKISYSKQEMRLMCKLDPKVRERIKRTKPQKLLCNAGSTAFFIDHKYNVFPCLDIRRCLGNFFDDNWKNYGGVIRCPKKYCSCLIKEKYLLDKTIINMGFVSKWDNYRLKKSINFLDFIDMKLGKIGIFLRSNSPLIYDYIKRYKK